jgi:hypothetical protein
MLAVILVCASVTAVPDCSRETAADILGSQPVPSNFACLMSGMLTGARYGVEKDHYLKVVCERRPAGR